MVVMMVMFMLVFMLVLQLFHLCPQSVFLHGGENLCAVQLRPGGRDQARVRVHALQDLRGLKDLLFARGVRPAHDNEVRARHLVVKELAEVARVHFGLARVHNRDLRADLRLFHAFHSRRHIRELPHAGGLDQDAVRGIVRDDLLQGLGEIAHQRAADTAGVHLRDLDPRVLQESAVDGDVAEFVFDQDQLFALVCFLNQFPDQCGFSGAEKSGKNVDFCHSVLASIYSDTPRGVSLFQIHIISLLSSVKVPSRSAAFLHTPSDASAAGFPPDAALPCTSLSPSDSGSAAPHTAPRSSAAPWSRR